MTTSRSGILETALTWHLENGADEALDSTPPGLAVMAAPVKKPASILEQPTATPADAVVPSSLLQGTSDLRDEAARLAAAATTREALKDAIASFEGIALKKTATNLVFCDGNPDAPVMVIGEAPGADEDRMGVPFVGISGQLLDRILAAIGLDRAAQDPAHAVYISNILNWRPPGNRNPTPAEVEVSLPFIERHIALVKPKLIILAGAVSAKALLNSQDSVSKLRGRWHNYTPVTPALQTESESPIPTLATYHPAYLLRTPAQKRAVWQDMLMVQEKRRQLKLL